MADDLDSSGVPDGWHPDGIMAGVPAMNAAAGQSTLPAVMTPEQMADVDWGEDEPPAANTGADDTGPDYGQQDASPPGNAVPPVEMAAAQPNDDDSNAATSKDGPAGNGPDHRFYSATGGKVVAAGWENPQNHNQGYGYRIKVQGDNGHLFIYGHADPGSVQVQPGDQVQQGQVLGSYGDPTNGRSDGPHTHLEERNPSQPLQSEYSSHIHNSRSLGAVIDPTPYAGIVMPGGNITSPFRMRTFQGGHEFHPGVDLSRKQGS